METITKINLTEERIALKDYLSSDSLFIDESKVLLFEERPVYAVIYNGTRLVFKHYQMDDDIIIPIDKHITFAYSLREFYRNNKPAFLNNKIMYFNDLSDEDKNQFENYKIIKIVAPNDLTFHQRLLYENI